MHQCSMLLLAPSGTSVMFFNLYVLEADDIICNGRGKVEEFWYFWRVLFSIWVSFADTDDPRENREREGSSLFLSTTSILSRAFSHLLATLPLRLLLAILIAAHVTTRVLHNWGLQFFADKRRIWTGFYHHPSITNAASKGFSPRFICWKCQWFLVL